MARYKCPSCGASYNGKVCRSCLYENYSQETSCSNHHREVIFDDGKNVETVPRKETSRMAQELRQATARQVKQVMTQERSTSYPRTQKKKTHPFVKWVVSIMILIFLLTSCQSLFLHSLGRGLRNAFRSSISAALPEPEPEPIPIPADGTVLYDGDGLLVVADWRDGQACTGDIPIIAENSTSQNLSIAVRDLVINGYMMDLSYLYCMPAAGTTFAGNLRLDEEDLQNAGIETIEEISFRMNIYDSDTYDTLVETDFVTFHAGVPDGFTQPPLEGGTTIWENGEISIRYLGYQAHSYHTEDFLEGNFLFYLENNTDRTIGIYNPASRINGEEADLNLFCTLQPGTRAVSQVYLYWLEDLGIDSLDDIQTMELHLEIEDVNDWEYAFQTDFIPVDVRQ